MQYLITLALTLFPRILIILIRIKTNWFEPVFQTWFWLILGIIFAPWTLLCYSIIVNWFYGQWGIWQIIALIIAIIVDLFSWSRLRFDQD